MPNKLVMKYSQLNGRYRVLWGAQVEELHIVDKYVYERLYESGKAL